MPFEPKFRTLQEVYDNATRAFATRPLFGTKRDGTWSWMTYGEFRERTEGFRGGLAALGVTKGDGVAVIANNRPEWAIGAYATYGLGASFVPMYEQQHDDEWEYILRDCGAKVLLVANERIAASIKKMRGALPALEHVVVMDPPGGNGAGGSADHTFAAVVDRGKASPAAPASIEPTDVAGFIYTSGTTGNPKGVLLTHQNLASNVSAVHAVFPMSPDDRSLAFLPWAHSFGQVAELHTLFSMGASMGLAEAVDKIVDNLAEVQPTLLFAVPRIFNRIYDGLHKRMNEEGGLKKNLFERAMRNEQHRRRLAADRRSSGMADFKHAVFDKLVFSKVRARFGGRLKYAFSGGAAISKEVAEFIDNLGIMVYEGYGLTETSPIATANWPGSRKIGSIGKAIPGVRVDIDKTVTGDPKNGEIIVHGHNVMKGYHGLPEENAKAFTPDGGFRTGDMGYMDEDGFVYITGRIKEQYKLENGKYVVPTPLEEQLKLSPFIANVMVFGDNRPYNVAIVVPDLDSLRRWASGEGLDASDPNRLAGEARVRALLESEVERHSGDFKQFEKVRKLAVVIEDFTQENGMLTPSLKLKRRAVMERHGTHILALYEETTTAARDARA